MADQKHVNFGVEKWVKRLFDWFIPCFNQCFAEKDEIRLWNHNPMTHPWDWYIYLHLPYFHIFSLKMQPNVGKYTSPMDGIGMTFVISRNKSGE